MLVLVGLGRCHFLSAFVKAVMGTQQPRAIYTEKRGQKTPEAQKRSQHQLLTLDFFSLKRETRTGRLSQKR